MILKLKDSVCRKGDSSDDDSTKGGQDSNENNVNASSNNDNQNKGKLILDATCAPLDILGFTE